MSPRFDSLTQEEFEQAPSPGYPVCTACADESGLSFDPLTQEESEQPVLPAAFD